MLASISEARSTGRSFSLLRWDCMSHPALWMRSCRILHPLDARPAADAALRYGVAS